MLIDSCSRTRWFAPIFGMMAIIGISAIGLTEYCPFEAQETRRDPFIRGSCTIFSVSKGDSVFFGNNEDWRNPMTYVQVEPAGDGKYGVLCVGFDDLGPQGGVNEKGLAFDGNALPYIPIEVVLAVATADPADGRT